MKEIGEKLREAREAMGISIEEAAEDLKLRPSQLENIEEGNREAFKDIFYLKYFIRDYSKYLGLDYEEMVEDFNEYVFDYTSKISLEDIKKANKKNESKNQKKIISPYTVDKKNSKAIPIPVIWTLILIFVGIIIYCVAIIIDKSNDGDNGNNGINERKNISYLLEG
jgi:Uncharacterized protein conserved in bacteria